MSKFKRYFFFFPILFIVLIPYTSVFVSATDYDYILEFPFEEPVIDEWTGYLLQPRYAYDYASGGNVAFDLIFWVITPILTDSNTSVPNVVYDYYAGSKIELIFGTGVQDVAYSLSVYRSSSYGNSSLGQIIPVYTGLISYDDAYTFTLDLTSRYAQFGRPTFKNLKIMDTTWPNGGPVYSVLWASDSVVYRELISASSKLTDLINGLDLTNEQLVEIYDKLSQIFGSLDTIDWTLTEFYDYFYWYAAAVEFDVHRILTLLETLVEGTEEYTESSTLSDKQNEMNNIEDELLNNEAASDAQNDIKVEINENAMSYIWDLITSFLSSNPKVFGLFISILSLGIIALVLNR